MTMAQTAVEFIEEGIKARERHWNTEYQQGYQRALSDIAMYIEEAKEMERKQSEVKINPKCKYCGGEDKGQ
jgi:hypothetical protein